LPAHPHRQQSADDQHQQTHKQKLAADHLVIRRKDVGAPKAKLFMMRVRYVRCAGRYCLTHRIIILRESASDESDLEWKCYCCLAAKFSAAHLA
jgi:hypothetical protein